MRHEVMTAKQVERRHFWSTAWTAVSVGGIILGVVFVGGVFLVAVDGFLNY